MNVITAGLSAIALTGMAASIRVAVRPLVRIEAPDAWRPGEPPAQPRSAPRRYGDSSAVVVARDPFRLSRTPAPVVYDPARLGQLDLLPPPKPVLAVIGILWDGGRNPTAVIEGLPGADGPRVVRAGERIGGLRVRAIERARVLIVGMDTTWALAVREPWK